MLGVIVRLICRDRAPAIDPMILPTMIAATALMIEPPIKPGKTEFKMMLGLKSISR